jgi:ACS family hexuronate transporter-like MFS transporter
MSSLLTRDASNPSPNSNLKWLVCGMLLLALVLNYMDRQTLSLTITAIEKEIQLSNTQYGRLEKGFGYAFAFGALFFGVLVDRLSVRWLYPAVLLGWSVAGLATGYADRLGDWLAPLVTGWVDLQRLSFGSAEPPSGAPPDPSSLTAYLGFLVCRVTLGFFEAGQWPCALVTTQRLLSRADRSLGNSILQSGASIGAILTPIVVGLFAPPVPVEGLASGTGVAALDQATAGWWRSPFVVIGAMGILWIPPWLWMSWGIDLRRPPPSAASEPANAAEADRAARSEWLLLVRRYVALLVVVIVLNMVWQYFRVWLPKMLEQYHGYSPREVRWFIVAYYVATDLGCLSSGALARLLATRGMRVHASRLVAFEICALLTSLSTLASVLPKGPLLLGILLLVGFGALGLFPNYYSFAQELTERHQGKVTGSLGFITWVVSAEMQEIVGRAIDRTQSYAAGIFWIGLLPLLGLAALLLLWGRRPHES